MKKSGCILFDCDGVLIDVSRSYREVIRQTVQKYFESCLKIPDCHRLLVTNRDIELFKNAGGYNNDWELTYGLIEMFLNYTPPIKIIPIKLHNIPRIIKFLNFIGPQLKITGNKLLAQKDVSAFLKHLSLNRENISPASILLFNQGELYETNLIKRIFQEYYLGIDNFTKIYHRRSLLYEGEGYINHEQPFIKREELEMLAQKFTLGVVTGRPKEEVEISFKRFGFEEYFSVVVTNEDVEEEEKKLLAETSQQVALGKPHPFSLLKAVAILGLAKEEKVIYVGDTKDDMRAASLAKSTHPFIAIGVLQAATNAKEAAQNLKEAGADYVLTNITRLREVL